METKHTKGEWNYKKFDITKIQYSYSIQSSNGDVICKMLRDDSDDNQTEEANAKLIAAAPELLEALESMVAYGNINYAYHSDYFITELKKCKQAIKKATL